MWPFSRKNSVHPSAPRADSLTPKEEQWLAGQRGLMPKLAKLAGDTPFDPADPLLACDAVIAWWHNEPAAERIDPNIVINACGVALGDKLAAAWEGGKLEWKIVTDEFGTDMALWSGPPRNIVLAPCSSIAKRFSESREGCVVKLHEAFYSQLRSV